MPMLGLSRSQRPKQRWSSVHANLAIQIDVMATPLRLDGNPFVRAKVYGEWLRQGVSEDYPQRIREHLQKERALVDRTFQALVERALGRPAPARPRGRPKRINDPSEGT